MNRVLWVVLAVAFAVTVARLLIPGEAEPAGGAVRILRGGQEVEVSGPLSLQLAAALGQAGTATVVQLDSAGGSHAGAVAVAAAIREAKQETAVTDRCLSVCAAAFMAGRRRWVGPFVQVGLDATAASLYLREGVPEALVREAAATPSGQAWFPTPAQMVQAGLATDEASPDQFALGGFGPTPTSGSIRDRLLTVPLYRAVAAADPEGFDATLGLWVATVLDGEPGTAAFGEMKLLLARTFDAALPRAADTLLLAHAALFRDELAWMREHSPDLCARWAAAQGGLPGPTDETLVRRRRDLELAVLSAATPPSGAPMEQQVDCAVLARQWQGPLSTNAIRSLLRPS